MESKKSFILYTDNYEAIRSLTYEQKGRLLDAAYLYEMGEELPEMDAVTAMAFSFIRISLDRDNGKWEVIRQKRVEAGRKGRAAKIKQNEQMQANANKCQQVSAVNVNVNDNVNVNVNDSVNVNVEEEVSSIPTAATATFEDRLKGEPVMLQAIANSAATTPQAVIAMLPDFADQLAIDGKQHKNYAEWRKHLQNYILKRTEKQRNNGNIDKRQQNGAFEPQKGVDYTRTDF